jgi:hypothetical protein
MLRAWGACGLSALRCDNVSAGWSSPFPRAVTMPGTRCFILSASGHYFSIHHEHDFVF